MITIPCYAAEIFFNNQKIEFENPVLNIDGLTYIPLRETFEKKGYTVEWNEESESIDIQEKKCPLYEEDLTEKEGYIKKDLKYKLLESDLTLDELFDGMRDITNVTEYARVYDSEMAAEIGSAYLKSIIDSFVPDELKDTVTIYVQYIDEINAWGITFGFEDQIMSHRSPPKVVISANDGRVMYMFGGW